MRLRLLLLACGLMLMSTLVMRASQSPATQNLVPGFPAPPPVDCGNEPCDAVHRGATVFVKRKLPGLDTNGRACADCHSNATSWPWYSISFGTK